MMRNKQLEIDIGGQVDLLFSLLSPENTLHWRDLNMVFRVILEPNILITMLLSLTFL
jgi:hypothetical protein